MHGAFGMTMASLYLGGTPRYRMNPPGGVGVSPNQAIDGTACPTTVRGSVRFRAQPENRTIACMTPRVSRISIGQGVDHADEHPTYHCVQPGRLDHPVLLEYLESATTASYGTSATDTSDRHLGG